MPLVGKVPMPVEELFRLKVGEKAVAREPERLADWAGRLAEDWKHFADSSFLGFERENKKGTLKTENLRSLLVDYERREGGEIFLKLNWRETYFSPLTLIRTVSPWLDAADIELLKLAQYF